MTSIRYQEALGDVTRIFRHPEEIVEAGDLSYAEKLDLLEQWERDMRLLMIATEENMKGANPGETADLLAGVRLSLRRLGASGRGKPRSAPDKAGGG